MTWMSGSVAAELVGDLAGAVGRVVVDDQDRGVRRLLADRLDERPEVRRLVVGGERDQEPRWRVERGRIFIVGEHGGGFPDDGQIGTIGCSRDCGPF